MTTCYLCYDCNQQLCGFNFNGCMVCKRKKILHKIRYLSYVKNLDYLPLPLDIISLIANFASDRNNMKIYEVHNDCYRYLMHYQY